MTPGGPVVPLVCGFWRRDYLLAWRVLFANLYELKSYPTTWSKFIGYIDLIDFRQISPKHSRNNDKRKGVGKFWYLKYLYRGVHLRHMPQVFLATPTLNADIKTTTRNIEKARHAFVDWYLVKETVQPVFSCCGIRYPITSIEEPSVVSRLTGSWYFLK